MSDRLSVEITYYQNIVQYPGLIPFAVLGQSTDAEETLRQATPTLDRMADPATQAKKTKIGLCSDRIMAT